MGACPTWNSTTTGGPLTFTARDQTDFVEAFYRSATSAPSAPRPHGRIELSVERLPDGGVSPHLMQDLVAGDRVELRGLIGEWFVWRDDQTTASASPRSRRVQRLPTGRDRQAGSMRRSLGRQLACQRVPTLGQRSRAEPALTGSGRQEVAHNTIERRVL